MKAIIPGLYMFSGLLVGRVYMIDDADGMTIIDAGIAPAADKIISQLSAAGRKASDVKRILITHAHPDHIGGLPKLQAATGAEVICSAAERPVAEGSIPVPTPTRDRVEGIFRFMIPPKLTMKGTPVSREIMEGDVLADVMGGLHILATPGHAPGQVAFWQPERKVLIIGDVMMHLFGRFQTPLPMATVDMAEAKRSIAKIAGYDAQIVCFGHGEPLMNGMEPIRAYARKLGAL